MKKSAFSILVGSTVALLSAVLIYFREHLGDVEAVKNFAQVALPFILAIAVAFLSGSVKERLVRIGLVLGSFYILLSLLEPFAFQYWITQTTSAGSVYSRYDMDALYPVLGAAIVLLAWVIGLVVVLGNDIFQRLMRKQ